MEINRSLFAGCTDFTGADLPELLRHLGNLRQTTQDTITSLHNCLDQVHANTAKLERVAGLLSYIDRHIKLFTNYKAMLERVIDELPKEVAERHVNTLAYLYEDSSANEDLCAVFSDRHIDRSLPDESMRPLIDRIYALTRGLLIDYKDLSNLNAMLKTYIGTKGSSEATSEQNTEILKLSPEFYGFGVNLKPLAKKALSEFRSKKKGS